MNLRYNDPKQDFEIVLDQTIIDIFKAYLSHYAAGGFNLPISHGMWEQELKKSLEFSQQRIITKEEMEDILNRMEEAHILATFDRIDPEEDYELAYHINPKMFYKVITNYWGNIPFTQPENLRNEYDSALKPLILRDLTDGYFAKWGFEDQMLEAQRQYLSSSNHEGQKISQTLQEEELREHLFNKFFEIVSDPTVRVEII